ncbi:MAG: hypothetical protein FD147_535 [Chloroflexi bacterium]|nr:MAG: hypothetical protein FD147_535 [Chloroflexota bacterium]
MKYPKFVLMILLVTILLAACSPVKVPVKYSIERATPSSCSTPEADKIGTCSVNITPEPTALSTPETAPKSDLTRSDAQGAVTMEITPEKLVNPGETLSFNVSMDTHSIDLTMDLAQLAVLTTNTGNTVQALKWVAPRGGHHVAGKLFFPATLKGKSLLDGAKSITITINDVDVPARIFIWLLNY